MPEMDGMVEPEITINGASLNFAQAMTVRVALESFAMWIAELPDKERTGVMENYQARMVEIRGYIFANQPRKK
jgi:hypothetical protein